MRTFPLIKMIEVAALRIGPALTVAKSTSRTARTFGRLVHLRPAPRTMHRRRGTARLRSLRIMADLIHKMIGTSPIATTCRLPASLPVSHLTSQLTSHTSHHANHLMTKKTGQTQKRVDQRTATTMRDKTMISLGQRMRLTAIIILAAYLPVA